MVRPVLLWTVIHTGSFSNTARMHVRIGSFRQGTTLETTAPSIRSTPTPAWSSASRSSAS